MVAFVWSATNADVYGHLVKFFKSRPSWFQPPFHVWRWLEVYYIFHKFDENRLLCMVPTNIPVTSIYAKGNFLFLLSFFYLFLLHIYIYGKTFLHSSSGSEGRDWRPQSFKSIWTCFIVLMSPQGGWHYFLEVGKICHDEIIMICQGRCWYGTSVVAARGEIARLSWFVATDADVTPKFCSYSRGETARLSWFAAGDAKAKTCDLPISTPVE